MMQGIFSTKFFSVISVTSVVKIFFFWPGRVGGRPSHSQSGFLTTEITEITEKNFMEKIQVQDLEFSG